MYNNIAVIGASGAIGRAFVQRLSNDYPSATIHAFSRTPSSFGLSQVQSHAIDYDNETSFERAAAEASLDMPLDLVIVATGILHEGELQPEKSLRELSAEKFLKIYAVNTVTPALVAKYFIPTLNREGRSVFAALSARVGSVSDNQLGGWYAYRASKAALNMIIKNTAIEVERRLKNAIIVGLHPGTVDSNLSKPFQAYVKEGHLFTADYAVENLIRVINGLTPTQSGRCFAWDGEEIQP